MTQSDIDRAAEAKKIADDIIEVDDRHATQYPKGSIQYSLPILAKAYLEILADNSRVRESNAAQARIIHRLMTVQAELRGLAPNKK